MNTIKVTDKYHIAVRDCFIVYERQVSEKTGEDYFVYPTYHYDLEGALNNILNRLTRDRLSSDTVTTILEAILALRQLKDDFEKLLIPVIDLTRVEVAKNESKG